MLPGKVFVIGPFDPEGQRVQDTVRRAVEEAGFGVLTRDDTFRNEPIITTILRSIRESDLIIADVRRLKLRVRRLCRNFAWGLTYHTVNDQADCQSAAD